MRTTPSLSVLHATKILEGLPTSPFPEEMVREITQALTAKTKEDGRASEPFSEAKARAQLQTHLYMHNYLTAQDWDTLRSLRQDFQNKCLVIVRRCSMIGLRFPSEPTYCALVAILLLSSHPGPPETLQFHPGTAYNMLRDVKAKLKAWKGFGCTACQQFPITVEDFKKMVPTAYEAAYSIEEPAQSQVDDKAVDTIRRMIPARKTHQAVAPPHLVAKLPRQASSQFDQMMEQWLVRQSQKPHANSPDIDLPGFMLLSPTPKPPCASATA